MSRGLDSGTISRRRHLDECVVYILQFQSVRQVPAGNAKGERVNGEVWEIPDGCGCELVPLGWSVV